MRIVRILLIQSCLAHYWGSREYFFNDIPFQQRTEKVINAVNTTTKPVRMWVRNGDQEYSWERGIAPASTMSQRMIATETVNLNEIEDLDEYLTGTPLGYSISTLKDQDYDVDSNVVFWAVSKVRKSRQMLFVLNEDNDYDTVIERYKAKNITLHPLKEVGTVKVVFDKSVSNQTLSDFIRRALWDTETLSYVEFAAGWKAFSPCDPVELKNNKSRFHLAPEYQQPTDPEIQYSNGVFTQHQQWHNQIGTRMGWRFLPDTRERIVVAVVDSGIDFSTKDYRKHAYKNGKETDKDGLDNDENGYVDDAYGLNVITPDHEPFDRIGHGNAIYSIITADGTQNVSGINPLAVVSPCKFLSDDLTGDTIGFLECVNYALMMKSRVLVSASGGPGSAGIRKAIRAAADRGVVVTAAVGNDALNTDYELIYPARYKLNTENVISVASVDSKNKLSAFSNFGSTIVDIGAPGEDVLAGGIHGFSSYFTGTSFSSAMVGGAASLIMQLVPEFSPAQIISMITSNVSKHDHLKGSFSSGGVLSVDSIMLELFGSLSIYPQDTMHGISKPVVVYPGETLNIPMFLYLTEEAIESTNYILYVEDVATGTLISKETVKISAAPVGYPHITESDLPKVLYLRAGDISPGKMVAIPFSAHNTSGAVFKVARSTNSVNGYNPNNPGVSLFNEHHPLSSSNQIYVQCVSGRNEYSTSLTISVGENNTDSRSYNIDVKCVGSDLSLGNQGNQSILTYKNELSDMRNNGVPIYAISYPTTQPRTAVPEIRKLPYQNLPFFSVNSVADDVCIINEDHYLDVIKKDLPSSYSVHEFTGDVLPIESNFYFLLGGTRSKTLYITRNGAIAANRTSANTALTINPGAELNQTWFGRSGGVIAVVWGKISVHRIHVLQDDGFIAIQFDYAHHMNPSIYRATAVLTSGQDVFVSYDEHPPLPGVSGGIVDAGHLNQLRGSLSPSQNHYMGLLHYNRHHSKSFVYKITPNTSSVTESECKSNNNWITFDPFNGDGIVPILADHAHCK